MPDSKITALTALTSADPAVDMFPVVDVSDTTMAASGTTKRISINNILACSPTATLASATITGDLTVDTSTLKVDSTNNRVGIVNASPAYPLDVNGAIQTTSGSAAGLFQWAYGASASSRSWRAWNDVSANGDFQISTSTTRTGSTYSDRYRIDVSGVHEWSNTSGLAMTLNSTGLGVGGSPVSGVLLTVGSTSSVSATANALQVLSNKATFVVTADGATNGAGTTINYSWANGGQGPLIFRNASISNVMTLDASGNCGIGVTPSAWAAGYKGLQLKDSYAGLFANTSSGISELVSNAYNDGAWKFANAGNGAARYQMDALNRTHAWFYAATSANPITWTQAMTLDASGNLLCGSTALNATWNTRLTLSSDSGTTRWAVGPYSTATNFVISSASGGGVYLNGTAATSWTSASDERLKDIIEPISNAIAKVGSLRAVIGKFKSDDTNTRKSFLMAQDVQSVLPEAVDASNPDRLGLAYTDVIPLLVAAIKELTAEVNALKNA